MHHDNNNLEQLHVARDCRNCSSSVRCLSGHLDLKDQALFSSSVRHHIKFGTGKRIFSAEQKFRSLYVIYSGAVKIQAYTYDGTNLISGFYFPGDLIGIESIGDSLYRNDAITLK